MKNEEELKETYELKLVGKKEKRSYKELLWPIFILLIAIAVIIGLALSIKIAKNGEI